MTKRAISQRKARRTGLTGRGRARRNLRNAAGASKVFDTSTRQGMKRAERYQSRLYSKYNSVSVVNVGLNRVKITGSGPIGAALVRRNLWPFSAFKTSTTYHVKRKRGPTTSLSSTFKGHRIEKRPDGGFVVPSIDRFSVFDDKRQAKRFITEQTKYNRGRKDGRPVMTYQLAHAAATDAANRAMRKAGRTAWSKADYGVAARTFKKLFKGNPPGEPGVAAPGARSGNTRTATEVRSPTKTSTSTDAYTAGNVTVTGGAGKGASTSVRIYQKKEPESKIGSVRPQRKPNSGKARKRKAGARKRIAAAVRAMSSTERKTWKQLLARPKKNAGTRRNPVDAAEDVYKKFHGRPAPKRLKITENVHVHTALSGIGDLETLEIRTVNGVKKFIDFGKGTVLAQNEKRNQLFIRGGDQSVSLKALGIEGPHHEQEVLGEVLSVYYYTTKDHLAPEDGGEATYRHKFGSKKPTLVYSLPDKLLSFAGGGYTIPDEGIDL